jgi:3-hydroxymyristoyl/3-hydroxydecanoyl-(acyl carrier protein) dehydratase
MDYKGLLMLTGKNVLILGAREGGYGASIASAAVRAGATVFGTSLDPKNSRERAFFEKTGITLLDVPLRFDSEKRSEVFKTLNIVAKTLREKGVERLEALIHTVAGGFPRKPSVMKAVGDILKGKSVFSDMATAVKRNVYYVNAGSLQDAVNGLSSICDSETQYISLTYRGDLPYFIGQTKKYLEKLSSRLGRHGKNTLVAAFPEAWTQSSQFFTGIEIAVMYNYVSHLENQKSCSAAIDPFLKKMNDSLSALEGFGELKNSVRTFLASEWKIISSSQDNAAMFDRVHSLFNSMRNDGSFPVLRRAVEIVSEFVRDASGSLLISEFVDKKLYRSGDVRQIYYKDLCGLTQISLAKERTKTISIPAKNRRWVVYEKDDIRKTLHMYGDNFLFLDRVIMEAGEFHDGMIGFARFRIPGPEQNPILKDHFVNMPVFGGHLQMEAVAQFGAFLVFKIVNNSKLVPILTGTEFPDLNTMAPPGEVLTLMGEVHMKDRRDLEFKAFIENRYARTKGSIRGMVLNERLVKKMLSSFDNPDSSD